MEPFDFQGVSLEGGRYASQLDEVRRFYLGISNDDLLKPFRQRVKLPAPGKDLGGWYSQGTFHIFGQILSGLARLHAATGDPACKEKALALLRGWEATIDPDGFCYVNLPHAPHYIYDKFVGGLVDMKLYCGSEDALKDLARITHWAEQHLDRSRLLGDSRTEWYTLSENLYRAYLASGDLRYRDFAKVWEYPEYWDTLARKEDLFSKKSCLGGFHAYSHVNTLGGLGAAYQATGERHYLEALEAAYDFLQSTQLYATGGFGPMEQLQKGPGYMAGNLEMHHAHFETPCGSWAGFKMSRYLICGTGDARFGDWAERLLINGIGATASSAPDGRVQYYSDYNLYGATKHLTEIPWSCCAGTRPIAVSDYLNLIYFRDAGSLCVNLFVPSSVHWKHSEREVVLRQETRFPEEDTIRLFLALEYPDDFTLRIRRPAWLSGPPEVRVNGETVEPSMDRHWLSVRRTWKSGDTVTLHLPMALTVALLRPDQPFPLAMVKGPVALAFSADGGNPSAEIRPERLLESLKPAAATPLTFHFRGTKDWTLKPLYTFGEEELYYLYLDPKAVGVTPHMALRYWADWKNLGGFHFSNTVGAWVTHTFHGTGICWMGQCFDDAGMAEVLLDGKSVAKVDQYGPQRGVPFEWELKNLPAGQHTIVLRIQDEKNPQSKDRFVNISGFRILP